MWRLIEDTVFGLVIAWRFATSPTLISSPLKETTDGVVLPPSAFGITFTSEPSIMETQLFVVPKSIPIILLLFAIFITPFVYFNHGWS